MKRINRPSYQLTFVGLKYDGFKIYEVFEVCDGGRIYKLNGEYYYDT